MLLRAQSAFSNMGLDLHIFLALHRVDFQRLPQSDSNAAAIRARVRSASWKTLSALMSAAHQHVSQRDRLTVTVATPVHCC